MPTFAYNPSFEVLLSGRLDYAVIVRQGCYIAWSKTREAPARRDYPAAYADVRDMLSADGYSRLTNIPT